VSPPERLSGHDIARIRAENPGPFTLSGRNTWVVGRDPCYVVDPGPLLEDHVAAIVAEVEAARWGGRIALTHSHADHSDAVARVAEELDVPVGAMASKAPTSAGDRDPFGPLTAIATPGHAPDHLAFVGRGFCFTGDAVLGEGSVFIAPDPGALRGYLEALERLQGIRSTFCAPATARRSRSRRQAERVHRPSARRERRLVAALDEGLRTPDELLDRVWTTCRRCCVRRPRSRWRPPRQARRRGPPPEGVSRPEFPATG